MSTDDSSIDWRIARFGAFAALAGTAVGALSSVVIAWWGFEREEDSSNRSAEEAAYVDFLTKADAFVYSLRYEGLAAAEEAPTFDEIYRLQSLMSIYGDQDIYGASNDMVFGISTALDFYLDEDKDQEVDDAAWDEYDEARLEFIVRVQDELEIDR